MLSGLKRKYRDIFEAYGEMSSRDTFEGELNYESGKLFFAILITMVIWLPYIPNDIEMHQFPAFAVSCRVGISLLSVFCMLLKFTKKFRNRPRLLMSIVIGAIFIGTSLLTATAGDLHVASYIGGFCLVLMIATFTPFTLKFKIVGTSASILLFFAVGIFCGLDFAKIQYSITDLFSAFVISVLIAITINNIKYQSWERRRKLKELTKAKSDFLAKMSHEIRTPMNAISGMAEIALRKKMPGTIREHILAIKKASSKLLLIINDILDFSKIESGKMEIVPSAYEFSALINDVLSIIKIRVMATDLKFAVNVDSRIPNLLFGDETRIRQILLNVLSNAVKYTKDGYISFSVYGQITGNTIVLTAEIVDSGRGIKKEDISKLFGEYVRFESTASRDVEGTGLGLVITKNLVEAMGGSISVESDYGKGSTFVINIPQKILSHEHASALHDKEDSADIVIGFNAPTARILIVDDINSNLKVAEGLMLPYKVQIDTATSGAESIEKITGATQRGCPYDLVFMDHMMPEMDGVETVKRIREMGDDLPIVALTANAALGVKEMFLANKFNDFLSKPIDLVKLNAILEEWIPREKQEDAKIGCKHDLNKINLQTLAVFYEDGLQKINQLKRCIETEDYPLYTIYVHALKSALANIGAREMSDAAKALEMGNAEFINTNTEQFLADLERLLNSISVRLGELKKQNLPDIDVLIKLRDALNTMNLSTINEAVNDLRDTQAKEILQNVLIGNYSEAIADIDNFLSSHHGRK
ncbi:MAG: ATP-binding protein [Fibromonadales bacterium]|nr:ATP-binding protein [Fibromonadales bacterium]